MTNKAIWLGYFTEEDRDKNFSEAKDYPMYQLSEGNLSESESHVFARTKSFKGVINETLKYLNIHFHPGNSYSLLFLGEKTEKEIGEEGKEALERILHFHNDFANPKRSIFHGD